MMKPNSHFHSLALFFLFLFFSPSFAHKKAHQDSPPPVTPPPSDCNPPPFSSPPVSYPPPSPPVSLPPVTHPPSSSSSPPVSHPPYSSSYPPVSTPPAADCNPPPSSSPPVSHPPPSSSSPPVSHPPSSSSSPPVSGPPVSHPPVSYPPFSSYSPPVSHPPSSSFSPPVSHPPSSSSSPPVSHTPSSSSPPVSSSPSPPSSSPPSPLEGSFKGCFNKVFAFGDSYTDTGNAHLLGDMICSSGSGSGSTCNGRKVVDYLCDALSIPHLAPYKDSSANFNNGVNFAVGGSTSLPKDYSTNGTIPRTMFKGTPKTLQTQIDWFHEFLQNKACKGKDLSTCKAEMGKALFWIGSMGVNDYTRASASSSFNIQGLAEMCITHTSKLMQTLLTNGAQNIVVQGLPPVGCLSSGKSLCPLKKFDKMGCSLTTNTAVMVHNKILQQMLTKFQSQFPGCKIMYADYWNAFMKIFTHPKQFNFEEPFKACCGAGDSELNFNINSVCGSPGTSTCKDPSKYMNWDGIHLTEAMHQHLSDLFLNQNFCRPSFPQLFKNKIGM